MSYFHGFKIQSDLLRWVKNPDAPILDEHQVPVEPETNELELTAELEAHEVDVPLVPEAAVNPLTVDSVTPSSFYVPPPTSVSH